MNPYAESLARPLPRRAASTARPARVAIRARKPCFLARRRVFGWKVRFVIEKLLIMNFYCGPEIRGKQGGNGRGLGISGSNWLLGVLGGVQIVDNQLLFLPNRSTFHSPSTGNRSFEGFAGLNLGFRPQAVDNPVDEFFRGIEAMGEC